ncbi:Alpha/Beta hydrolase protein [Lasiosphaeria hispida]|uniref:Alpha/Beta hydrolase protein n=1 Tax=Lasiosphaeria hispida TaxID=260671 RepID=A0AAJ0HH93_9PEZI|nr:Alpha/Beta hydrolase protein [Lasiosphaeria hispida]
MALFGQSALTAREKADLAFRLAVVTPFQLPLNVIRCLIIAKSRCIPLLPYATTGVMRTILQVLQPRQVQALVPSCIDVYTSWIPAKQKALPALGLRLDTESVPGSPDASLFWIGNRHTAKKFVLHFHGGAFYVPLQAGHLEWCLQAYVQACNTSPSPGESDVAVAVLDYSLAPAHVYPTPLIQAINALQHLLTIPNCTPSTLMIGGDSAGGTLAAQLLGHLLHPYPHPTTAPIALSEPLAGAFLVSPWLSGSTAGGSFDTNAYIDVVTADIMAGVTQLNFSAATPWPAERAAGNGWALPLDVEAKWLDGLERVVGSVYVTAGEQEVLRDQAVEYVKRARERAPGVEVRLDLFADQAHDFLPGEAQAGEGGPAMTGMKEWARGVFGPRDGLAGGK